MNIQLVPNPTIVVIQFFVFCCAIGVIRYFFVMPYLFRRSMQEEVTSRLLEKAESLENKHSSNEAQLKEKLTRLNKEVQAITQEAQDQSNAYRSQKIAGTEAQIEQDLIAFREKLRDELQSERQKLVPVLESLKKEFVSRVLQ